MEREWSVAGEKKMAAAMGEERTSGNTSLDLRFEERRVTGCASCSELGPVPQIAWPSASKASTSRRGDATPRPRQEDDGFHAF